MYNDTVKMADVLPLEKMLLTRMKRNYQRIMEKNGGEVFCEQSDLEEFYGHGLLILDFFKKRRQDYFSKKGYELKGIEIPIQHDISDNLKFIGYVDVLLYDKIRDKYRIIDIKTSTIGWNKYVKADINKTDQLLLYKQFYSKQHDIPLDKIDVEYFIIKRKLYENLDFPQKRVQKFVPANGKPSMNKMVSRFEEFLKTTYDEKGIIKNIEYEKCVGKCKAFNKCKDL
tara:strand:- start:815 stop:1495 length:681 start_codon:yes stop_codon:yes gene_type:complete